MEGLKLDKNTIVNQGIEIVSTHFSSYDYPIGFRLGSQQPHDIAQPLFLALSI